MPLLVRFPNRVEPLSRRRLCVPWRAVHAAPAICLEESRTTREKLVLYKESAACWHHANKKEDIQSGTKFFMVNRDKTVMSSLQQNNFKHSLAVQDAALLVLEAMEGDAGLLNCSRMVMVTGRSAKPIALPCELALF